MRDVLGKMRECGKYIKMQDFPHDCGMVDTYAIWQRTAQDRVIWRRHGEAFAQPRDTTAA